MAVVVADTHAAVWYLTNSPRLSSAAAKALDDASAAGDSILIPAISLVELTYLVEKGRVPAEARKRLVDALAEPGGPYELAPLDGHVAAAVELIDRRPKCGSGYARPHYCRNRPFLPRCARQPGRQNSCVTGSDDLVATAPTPAIPRSPNSGRLAPPSAASPSPDR
jgi:PIN domain nuclease of toxin-antitoxin system